MHRELLKQGADTILISGNDGGTGASPLGSLKHTGLPWEIGLSEVHRTLTQNGLRSMVTLRIDGGLKNARNVIMKQCWVLKNMILVLLLWLLLGV